MEPVLKERLQRALNPQERQSARVCAEGASKDC